MCKTCHAHIVWIGKVESPLLVKKIRWMVNIKLDNELKNLGMSFRLLSCQFYTFPNTGASLFLFHSVFVIIEGVP